MYICRSICHSILFLYISWFKIFNSFYTKLAVRTTKKLGNRKSMLPPYIKINASVKNFLNSGMNWERFLSGNSLSGIALCKNSSFRFFFF